MRAIGSSLPGGADEGVPDAGGVVAAYLTAHEWVRAFDPPPVHDPASALPIEGAAGACVIVRHNGRILGTGVDAGDAPERFVRRAAGRALSEVLGDRVVTALPDAARAELGASVVLELEVAGELTVLPGRTFAQIADQIEPGLDGIAIRRGESLAMLFPAQMLAMNTAGALERLLPGLAVELGLPARDYNSLRRQYGIRAYRFRTIHLAQRAPGGPAFQTVRGHTVVRQQSVDRAAIVAFCDALARHIMPSGSGDERVANILGTYRPVSDTYEPLIASPRDQALCALALARYARTAGMDAETANRARQVAAEVLALQAEDGSASLELVTDAAIVLACAALDDAASPTITTLAADAGARVLAALQPDGRFVDGANPMPPTEQALLVAALCRLPEPRPDATTIRAALDATWTSVPERMQAALLPWIGWAELDSAGDGPLARLDDLRRLREQLTVTRIDDGPPDVRGALALTTAGRARLTAQTIRPAAWLATMLRDDRLTPPGEAPTEQAGHLRTMRFVLQLAVADRDAWAIRRPGRALGGIRASTWDSTQPTAAQAMGLLLGVETVISLDATHAQGP